MGITEFVNNDAELKKIEDSIKQLKKESSTINLKIENAEYDLFMRRGRLVEQWRKKNHYS